MINCGHVNSGILFTAGLKWDTVRHFCWSGKSPHLVILVYHEELNVEKATFIGRTSGLAPRSFLLLRRKAGSCVIAAFEWEEKGFGWRHLRSR